MKIAGVAGAILNSQYWCKLKLFVIYSFSSSVGWLHNLLVRVSPWRKKLSIMSESRLYTACEHDVFIAAYVPDLIFPDFIRTDLINNL